MRRVKMKINTSEKSKKRMDTIESLGFTQVKIGIGLNDFTGGRNRTRTGISPGRH